MKSIFRVLYLYVISAITLSMIVAGLISMVVGYSEYLFPEYTYSKVNNPRYYEEKYNYEDSNSEDTIGEIVDNNDDSRNIEAEKMNDQISAVKQILTSLAIVVVSTPLYIYHWGKIEGERKEMED